MEDLVPLLIFLAIGIANLIKYLAEQKARKGTGPGEREDGGDTAARPSPIEEFLGELAEKFGPQPIELPDWPEERERPDYMKEAEEYDRVRALEYGEEFAAAAPAPMDWMPAVPLAAVPAAVPRVPPMASVKRLSAAKSPLQHVTTAAVTGSHGMRMQGINELLRSNATGILDYDLKGRKSLRNALVGQIVFSPPKALDRMMDNTIIR